MSKETVFFSWQSDIRAAANRTLIESALEGAIKQLGSSLSVELAIDRDTRGLPGSPHIRDAIFAKIEKASVFVADVTPIVTTINGRLCPNPNVLIELGYAIKSIGWPRIVLVLNTAFGRVEDLPFDLRGHRCRQYESPEEAPDRSSARKALQSQVQAAIAEVFESNQPHPGKHPVQLIVEHKPTFRSQEHHDYEFHVTLKNDGHATLKDWMITIEIPTRILPPGMQFLYRVGDMSDHERTFFQFRGDDDNGYPLMPERTITRGFPYYVDTAMFRERKVFERQVVVKAYVNDELLDEVRKPFEELQEF